MELIHGGDLVGYWEEYGREPLDFSANCNPVGMPKGVIEAAQKAVLHSHRYPDPLCRDLRGAISRAEGVPASWVLCGNGAADLIFRLVLAVRPRRAMVLAPTFAEYEQALSVANCLVQIHFLREEEEFCLTHRILEEIVPGLDMLFLCCPNNPTGQPVERELLVKIARRCQETGTILVLDECFCCLLDRPQDYTMTGCLEDFPSMVILKAFTKLYAMAGLRLGYCLCTDHLLLEKMAASGQPWAVSQVAQEAGIAALGEREYRERSRELIQGQREYLREQLASLGIQVIGSHANYLFIKTDFPDFGRRLKERGILLRSCANYRGLSPSFYRLAVRSAEENRFLIREIRDLLFPSKGAEEYEGYAEL